MHISTFSVDQINIIQQILYKLIPQEVDLSCRYFLCDAVYSFISSLSHRSQNDDNLIAILSSLTNYFFSLGNELIKSPQFLSTGIYLFSNIFPLFIEINSNNNDDILFTLLNIFSFSIRSENIDDRLQALKLFDVLRLNFPDELKTESQNSIFAESLNALLTEMQTVIFHQPNIDELSHIILVVGGLIDDPPEFVTIQHLSAFVEIVVSALANRSLSLEVRYLVHQLLDGSIDIILSDGYSDQIIMLVQLSVDLSLEMCFNSRDETTYEFPLPFFYSISDANENSYELFMSIALKLAQNASLPEKQVSLFIVKSIIEGLQETISNKIIDIVNFVLQTGDVNDQYVFGATSRTIEELVEFVSPALSKHIDDVAMFLVKYIHFPEAVRTLDMLFYRCENPPKGIDFIFNGLAALVSSANAEQTEALLSCIASLFSRTQRAEEEALSYFIQLLGKMHSARAELRCPILEFFGRMASVAPRTIKTMIPTIVQVIMESFSNDLNKNNSSDNKRPEEENNEFERSNGDDEYSFQLIISACTCFKSISAVLPQSFTPFLPQIVPPLISMLVHQNGDSLPDYLLPVFSKAQRSAMSTLAAFVGFMPQAMADFAQHPILDFIVQPDGGLRMYLVDACESIAYSAEGFKTIGVPLFEVIKMVIPHPLIECKKKDHVFSILLMVFEVVAVFGQLIPEETYQSLLVAMMNILREPPPGFLKTEHSYCIDQSIQGPFFLLLFEIIDVLALNFFAFSEDYFKILNSFFNNKSSLMKSNAVLACSHICGSCLRHAPPSNKNSMYYQLTLNAAIQMIMKNDNDDIEPKRNIAKALKLLLMADKTQIQARLSILFPFSLEVIETCQYPDLWCAIFMSFYGQVEVFADESAIKSTLQTVIDMLNPLADSENVVFEAEFAVFLKRNNIDVVDTKLRLVAAALFASSDKHFMAAEPQTRAALAEVIAHFLQQGESEVINNVYFDEAKMMRIQNHFSMMNSSA